MKARITVSCFLSVIVCLGFLYLPALSPAAINFSGENNYCIVPPFIETPITPNLLLTIDNSASMFDPFWVAGSTSPLTTYDCGGSVGTVSNSFCFDNTFSNANTYEGYFDSATVYKYVETPADNGAAPGANDKWQVSAMPMGCGYKNATGPTYVCINIPALVAPYQVTDFYATGNFLNWLTASKFDIEKKILTGGKYDTASGLLISESRGCVGKRFVKVVDDVAGITFALRGPSALEPDFVNPQTQGGLTRVEIYRGTNPNLKDCQCAVANWTLPDGSYGQAQTNTKNCLNIGAGTAAGNEIATFNHSLGTCWAIKENIKKGQPLFGPPNTTDLTGACLNAYKDICGGNLRKVGSDYFCTMGTPALADDIHMFNAWGAVPGSAQLLTTKLQSDISGNWICTGYLDGVIPRVHNLVTPPYDTYGNDTAGFLGRCVTNFTRSGQSIDFDWTPAVTQDCVKREALHYCYGAEVAEVTDPSEGAADTSTTGNIPSVIMDSSIRSLGTPAGTFFIRVPATNPRGLLQDYEGRIRFGSMSFNQVGTRTECLMPDASIKCPTAGVNLDGGKVLTPVSEVVGSHAPGGGLINTLDSIVAETWTPFSEAMYNAIGYYAQRPDLRINASDFNIGPNPADVVCRKNNILLISDGLSTADLHPEVRTMASVYNNANTYDPAHQVDITTNNACMKFAGSRNMDDIAWIAQNRNIYTLAKAAASADPPVYEKDKIYTYAVYSGVATAEAGECNPLTLMQDTASRGGGSFAQARSPAELKAAIKRMFEEVAGRSASGTAASVLASGEGSGANLLQAIFYPKKEFEGGVCSNAAATSCTSDAGCPVGGTCVKDITWTGTLHNLWYYVDPKLGSSTIREDTTSDSNTMKKMELDRDYIMNFAFDSGTKTTYVRRYESDAAGAKGAEILPSVSLDGLKFIWEAGRKLHDRSPDTRKVLTHTTGAALTKLSDLDTSDAAIQTMLQTSSAVDASLVLKYAVGHNKFCQGTSVTCNTAADCGGLSCENIYRNRIVTKTYPDLGSVTNTWKLGDIVNSTPKLVTWIPLNAYDRDYNDQTYAKFLQSDTYKYRGTVEDPPSNTAYGSGYVFSGANDGMLHAFKLGALGLVNDGTALKARILDSAGELGKEEWAFIPKNALPYLKYLMDPSYSHLYYVDATPYIFDASIGTTDCTEAFYWNCDKKPGVPEKSWRTILIGGMRLGGATKNACTNDLNSDMLIDNKDCVQTPVAGEGFSSYFALDITNPTDPKLLWEFSNPELGFATSGPAIVRIAAREPVGGVSFARRAKNGRWFAVFASGPIGPIDTVNHQLKGFSDQNLKLFILDLKTGDLLRTIDTGIANAFGGSLNNAAIDYDVDYQDDALYLGYTRAEGPLATSSWTDGGVLRLVTREDLNSIVPAATALNPANWELTPVIENIGAVTSAVSHLAHYPSGRARPDKAWLYFGTGRFFYKTLSGPDDPNLQRALYGINEPCLTKILYDNTTLNICNGRTVARASLADATSSVPASADKDGWYIELDPSLVDTKAERVITDTLATPSGSVFFTTFSPSSNPCSFGGKTHLWATKYDTGGSVASGLRGKVLLQVSTGEIKELDLSTVFFTSADNPDSKLDRRSFAMEGVPPTGQGLALVMPPKPSKKIMHLKRD